MSALVLNVKGSCVDLNTLFSLRLKEERERLGMSQQEAADLSGVRREMWGKYERGAAEPGISVIERFCAHGADVLYIVTGKRVGSATPLDAGLLKEVIQGVEDGLKSKRVVLDSFNKAGLIVLLYEHFSPTKKVDMDVINLTLSQR